MVAEQHLLLAHLTGSVPAGARVLAASKPKPAPTTIFAAQQQISLQPRSLVPPLALKTGSVPAGVLVTMVRRPKPAQITIFAAQQQINQQPRGLAHLLLLTQTLARQPV